MHTNSQKSILLTNILAFISFVAAEDAATASAAQERLRLVLSVSPENGEDSEVSAVQCVGRRTGQSRAARSSPLQ